MFNNFMKNASLIINSGWMILSCFVDSGNDNFISCAFHRFRFQDLANGWMIFKHSGFNIFIHLLGKASFRTLATVSVEVIEKVSFNEQI